MASVLKALEQYERSGDWSAAMVIVSRLHSIDRTLDSARVGCQDLFIRAADGGQPVYEDILDEVIRFLHSGSKSPSSFQVNVAMGMALPPELRRSSSCTCCRLDSISSAILLLT